MYVRKKRSEALLNCDGIHRYSNLLERNFYAERPNLKSCTDISYIPLKEGFVYPSVIKDLYDSFVVTYKVGPKTIITLFMKRLKRQKERSP